MMGKSPSPGLDMFPPSLGLEIKVQGKSLGPMDRCPYPSSRETQEHLGRSGFFLGFFLCFFFGVFFSRFLRSFVGGVERDGMVMLLFMHKDMGWVISFIIYCHVHRYMFTCRIYTHTHAHVEKTFIDRVGYIPLIINDPNARQTLIRHFIALRHLVTNIEPHEAVPEVSRSKVHITQNKHVPIEWFVTTASQSRIWLKLLSDDSNKVGICCFVAARNCMRQQVAGRSSQRHATLPTYWQSSTPYWKSTTLYYKVLIQYYSVLQSNTPVLLCTAKCYSSTTLYYTILLQYYSVLHSATPVLLRTTKYYSSITLYYKVLLQYYSVLQSTTPVLLCTTQCYSSTTLYYKVLLQYYSVLQSTTPVLLYYKVLLQYYSVLHSTTPVLLCTRQYYSSTTLYYTVLLRYYSVLQSTTPVLLCTTKYYSSTTLHYKVLLQY